MRAAISVPEIEIRRAWQICKKKPKSRREKQSAGLLVTGGQRQADQHESRSSAECKAFILRDDRFDSRVITGNVFVLKEVTELGTSTEVGDL